MAKKTTEMVTTTTKEMTTLNEDITTGGLALSDLEMPRALILQKMSPDVEIEGLKPGMVINSISKERLGNVFIPLFFYKQYAKFPAGETSPEWSTMDRTDPRVQEGLTWNKAVNDGKPTVTEFINVLAVFTDEGGGFNTDVPLILSFKRTSLKEGKRFLTLTEMKPKPVFAHAYELLLKESKAGQGPTWYAPQVIVKKGLTISPETMQACSSLIERFKPIIKQVPVVAETAESFE